MKDIASFLRDQRTRRMAEDHVRRTVAPELFFDDHERLKRMQQRMSEMAAVYGYLTADDDDTI